MITLILFYAISIILLHIHNKILDKNIINLKLEILDYKINK